MADKWYTVKVPKEIVARPGDAVSYTAIDWKTEKKVSKNMGAACYHAHMNVLPQHTFDCIPCNTKKSILSPDDFFLWMKFCTAFGVCPPGTVPYTKGESNCALISGRGDCKHRIYAGLCCYRWAECLAPMCYEACRLIEARPDIDFHRIFHYVTGKYVTLIGHSFTNVSAASMAMYGNYGANAGNVPRTDHMWGLGVKLFFEYKSDGTCEAMNKKMQGGLTQTAIASFINKLGISLPVKNSGQLLDDKWAELYNLTNPTKKELKECYDKLIGDDLKVIPKKKPVKKA